jgi:predicted kinase
LAKPTLVVISGPAGCGKTTLAHELARAIRCPAICRDEIKEGMVHALDEPFEPGPGDPLTARTFPVFFEVLEILVRAKVTLVAEAAFQDKLWRPNLEPLLPLAKIRIVQCHTDKATTLRRLEERASQRNAHVDLPLVEAIKAGDRYYEYFDRVSIDVPSIDVDTTDGYAPSLDEIVAFVDRTDL